jgi:DNA-binding transcriptional MocR family regulator
MLAIAKQRSSCQTIASQSNQKGPAVLHVIEGFGRIGEENAFAVLARATALAAQGRDIINLGIGQPDFKTPQHIVEAAIKALRDGHHGYTPATGILPLREAVARRTLATTGVEVSPERIIIVPGGKVTMFAAILMFGRPGAEILYPDPGFPIYRSMIEFTGATPVPVPIREANGFAFSAEETLSLITPRTRLLILNSPANPTGGVTPKAEIEGLVATEKAPLVLRHVEIAGEVDLTGLKRFHAFRQSREKPVELGKTTVHLLLGKRAAASCALGDQRAEIKLVPPRRDDENIRSDAAQA